jgi:uncharacterized protein (DUF302 family)
MGDQGLITVESAHSVAATLERLETALHAKGIQVFARVDHAAGAAAVGLALRPTLVLIFGDPRAGTPLMRADQRAGLDLPLKVLVWEGEDGHARATYCDPRWIAARYGLPDGIADRLAAALEGLVKAATS